MNRHRPLFLFFAASLAANASAQHSTTDVATYISAADLAVTIEAAPEGRVSDQQIRHIDAGDGYIGVGVVQRPALEAQSEVRGIQHHKQGEVYRVVSGSGTLVTSKRVRNSEPLDPKGNVVLKLTGPSSLGIIENGVSQKIAPGDIIIIPAGVAHGFSEITETITYMVVRIDPEKLVELK